MRSFGFTLLLIVISFFSTNSHSAEGPGDLRDPLPDLVEKILPSVVNISSTSVVKYQVYGWNDFLRLWGIPHEQKNTSLGSGFFIDSQGFILTNLPENITN